MNPFDAESLLLAVELVFVRIGTSNVSRRFDAAKVRALNEDEFQASYKKVNEHYTARKATKQA